MAKQTYTKEQIKLADEAVASEDRMTRWRKAADLARELNPDVKKEQDYQIKACAEVRRLGLYKKDKTEIAGLKLAVSIPPMTFNVLSYIDPYLRSIDKEDWQTKEGSNEIAKQLSETFPEYRVS